MKSPSSADSLSTDYSAVLLEAITETTVDGILVVDGEGKTISANGRFAEIWRIPEALLKDADDQKMIAHVLEQLEDPDAFAAGVQHYYANPAATGRDVLVFKDSRVIDRYTSPLVSRRDGTSFGRVWYFRDVTDSAALRRLQEEATRLQQQVIASQQQALRALSTPLIPIADDVLLMPLIGAIDSERVQQILDVLLTGVSQKNARVALLDLTGVSVVDSYVAQAIVRAATACRLLGAKVVLSGIQPAMAQSLVRGGLQLESLIIVGTVQAGIAYALGARQRA